MVIAVGDVVVAVVVAAAVAVAAVAVAAVVVAAVVSAVVAAVVAAVVPPVTSAVTAVAAVTAVPRESRWSAHGRRGNCGPSPPARGDPSGRRAAGMRAAAGHTGDGAVRCFGRIIVGRGSRGWIGHGGRRR